MFQAMWTLSDRNGRLQDRPRRLKIECLPFDDHDIEGAIDDLHAAKFIDRYEAEGEKYIEIVNFSKHQKPHPKEPAEYPANPHGYQEPNLSTAEPEISSAEPYLRARESVLAVSGKSVGGKQLEEVLRDLERTWPRERCRIADRPLRDSALFDVADDAPDDLIEQARLYVEAHGFSSGTLAGCPNLHRWIREKRWLEPLPVVKPKPADRVAQLQAEIAEAEAAA